MAVSPKHAIHYLWNPDEGDSYALILGRAVHAAVLEPGRIKERIKLGPINPSTSKPFGPNTDKFIKFAAEAERRGFFAVHDNDAPLVRQIRWAMRFDEEAKVLVEGEGLNEFAIVWDEPLGDSGVTIRCKVKVDRVRFGTPMRWLDLKTTRNIDPDAFGRDCYNLGYDIQLAHTLRGLLAAVAFDDRFTTQDVWPNFIAVENKAPYDVVVYDPEPEFLQIGTTRRGELFRRFAWCMARDQWPGVSGGQRAHLALPGWAKARFVDGEM